MNDDSKIVQNRPENGYENLDDPSVMRSKVDSSGRGVPTYDRLRSTTPDVQTMRKTYNETALSQVNSRLQRSLEDTPEEAVNYNDAHDVTGNAANLTKSQGLYQNELKQEIGLDGVMKNHRSAGFEFEFANYHEKGVEPRHSEEPEFLASHVLLGQSDELSDLYNTPFRLETDSRNSLEMVMPPFIFDEARDIDVSYCYETYLKQSNRLRGMLINPENTSLSDKTSEFEPLGFYKDWEMVKPGEKEYCATAEKSKHGQGSYGQMNVSMTPDEIGKSMKRIHEGDFEGVTDIVSGSTLKPPDPDDKINALAKKIIDTLILDVEDDSAARALIVFGRYTSNLVGIPSIIYRQASGERPTEANLATSIKETMGIWVKDFHVNVLSGLLGNNVQSSGKLIEMLDARSDPVLDLLRAATDEAITALQVLVEKSIKNKYGNEIEAKKAYAFLTYPGEDQQETRKKLLMEMMQEKMSAMEIFRTTHGFIVASESLKDTIVEEYKMMVSLITGRLKKQEEQKQEEQQQQQEEEEQKQEEEQELKIPKRGDPENFGLGHGVRKETYLPGSPGVSGKVVVELRDPAYMALVTKSGHSGDHRTMRACLQTLNSILESSQLDQAEKWAEKWELLTSQMKMLHTASNAIRTSVESSAKEKNIISDLHNRAFVMCMTYGNRIVKDQHMVEEKLTDIESLGLPPL